MSADDDTIAHLRPKRGISISAVPSSTPGTPTTAMMMLRAQRGQRGAQNAGAWWDVLVAVRVVRRHVVRLPAVREELRQKVARNHKSPTHNHYISLRPKPQL